MRHLLVDISFKDFWYVWQYADMSTVTFLRWIAIFTNRCDIGHFHRTRKFAYFQTLLSSLCVTSMKISEFALIPVGNYLFKVKSKNTRIRCETCSKLTIKVPERRPTPFSGIFIINFEHISHLCLLFLALTLSR